MEDLITTPVNGYSTHRQITPKTIDLWDNDLRPMQYWAKIAEDKLLQWATGEAEGHSTGFSTLDKYFRLVDGELLTIAARPSQGKTVLGMQLAENVAKSLQMEGKTGCVAVFSAEMTGWSLVHRTAAALSVSIAQE